MSEEEKERFLESRNLGYAKDKRIIKKDSNMLYNSFNEINGNNEYSFDIPDSVFLNNNNIQLNNNVINIDYTYKTSNTLNIINNFDIGTFYAVYLQFYPHFSGFMPLHEGKSSHFVQTI